MLLKKLGGSSVSTPPIPLEGWGRGIHTLQQISAFWGNVLWSCFPPSPPPKFFFWKLQVSFECSQNKIRGGNKPLWNVAES